MSAFTHDPGDGDGPVEVPIGEVISGLEMGMHVEPDELVVGAIVLVKTVTADGHVGLKQTSNGVDWLTRIGMLRQASNEADLPAVLKVLEQQMASDPDEED